MRVALAALAAFAGGPAFAAPDARSEGRGGAGSTATPAASEPAWCSSEVETLSDGMCHIDGGQPTGADGRRTLVIFLHGAIARNVTWQWTQERALLRQAKQGGFSALFPRAPLSAGGYVWQLRGPDRDRVEEALIQSWKFAQKTLEARNGKPFDEVFVMGFSSGAYYVGSLAIRGRMEVDGYATFAGGLGGPAGSGAPAHRAPVFIGVCADDRQTAPDSRSLAGALAGRGIVTAVDEQRVGHMFSDVHVLHAVSFLRRQVAKARAK
jgi:predicted esterase